MMKAACIRARPVFSARFGGAAPGFFICKALRLVYLPHLTPTPLPPTMKISTIVGAAAVACLALSPVASFAQDAPASEKAAKPHKPLVIVSRPIDGKTVKGGNGNWLRLEVELKALPEGVKALLQAQGVPAKFAGDSVKWVNNVKVSIVAGFKPSGTDLGKPKVFQEVLRLKERSTDAAAYEAAKDSGKIENWRFYNATCTVLTLETNSPRSVFFYIPADIVKRDGITNPRPDVAYVTLEVDGQEVPIMDEKGALFTGSNAVLFGGSLKAKPDAASLAKVKETADRAVRDTAGVMRPQNFVTGFIDADWKSSPEFVREEAAK